MSDPNEHMSDDNRQEEEHSQGGSRIHRYSGNEGFDPQFGFTEEDLSGFMKERERVYEEVFGKLASVSHEILPLVPHIDVYQIDPNEDRSFYTLVTGGMSDLRMTVPDPVSDEYARAELVFYCREPRPEYSSLLNKLAHFPHNAKTWFCYGHTFPNGNPPEPIFDDNSELDTILLMGSILKPDSDLTNRLVLGGDPVNLLWVVPITTAECDLKLEQGMDSLLDLFDANDHPFIFDPFRESYV